MYYLIRRAKLLQLFFTEFTPRPIQSIRRDIRAFLYVIALFASSFLNVSLLPSTKVKCRIDQFQKDSLVESCERTLVSEFAILSQNWCS